MVWYQQRCSYYSTWMQIVPRIFTWKGVAIGFLHTHSESRCYLQHTGVFRLGQDTLVLLLSAQRLLEGYALYFSTQAE